LTFNSMLGALPLIWVTCCLRDYVGITTGVPQIAADLVHRPSRQSRAKKLPFLDHRRVAVGME
jgi:hypothetical protein